MSNDETNKQHNGQLYLQHEEGDTMRHDDTWLYISILVIVFFVFQSGQQSVVYQTADEGAIRECNTQKEQLVNSLEVCDGQVKELTSRSCGVGISTFVFLISLMFVAFSSCALGYYYSRDIESRVKK